jgi:serine/threonine-protein kinase
MAEPKLVRPEDDELEPELIAESDDSVVEDRTPRAPQLKKLGRYRLVREIASGGMASVNLAVSEGLDKLVALKLIHPHLAQEEAFVQMFLDEARIASSISHRNVCNTFDFGEAEGRFYIAMDYLAGHSLRDVILRLRKSPEVQDTRKVATYVAYIIAEACEGLHAAHELRDANGNLQQVVHRDVSPHNLFLTYDGNVSVVDFGIARASDRIQHTATGVLKGKFSYMAPEQVRQLEVDRRADIWALGVCLWETVTCERLFVRSSQADTLMSVMMDRIRPPSEVKPDIPKTIDDIAIKALARNPAQRYATAREMGRDLMQVVRESNVLCGPVELEQWMETLFPRERENTRALTRYAKQAASDASWLEATPSGHPRMPTRSGAMMRAPAHTSSSVSRSVAHSGVSFRRVPDNDAEATPDIEISLSDSSSTKAKRRTVLAAVIGLSAAVGLAWGMPDSFSFSSVSPAPALSVQQGQPVIAPKIVVTEQPIAIQPAPVAPVQEQAEAEPPTPDAPTGDERENTRAERAPERHAFPTRAGSVGTLAQKEKVSLSANPSRGAPVAPTSPGIPETGTAAAPQPKTPPASTVHTPSPSTQAAAESAPAIAASAPREVVSPTSTPPASAPAPAPAPVAAQPEKPEQPPAPPQKLDATASMDDVEVEGSLGSGVVARMLSRSTPLVHTCYVQAAKRAGKNDFSPLELALTIDEMGAVRDVRPASHPLAGLSSCVAGSMKRLRSDRKPDVGTVKVRLQLSFRPQ